jgi:RNA recognition motif-containing protein
VYVGNLSWETSWQDLKDHFRAAGEVSHADVMMEHDGRSKGCAIVRFASAQDAANAIQQMHDSELQGRTIFVREDREAGGGGGGGGGYSAETGGLPPPVVQYNAPAASRAVGGGRGEGAQQYGAPAVGLPPARPKATGGGSGSQVYVGNLSWDTSWQDLKDHFRAAGEVSHADVMMEHDGRSKGCGIVSFVSARDAGNAIASLHDSELQGRKIFVREDREATAPGGGKGKGGGQGTGGCQVYVGNLPWETNWMNLKVGT